MRKNIGSPAAGLLVVALILPSPTPAQDESLVLDEVVVTAQKRTESLQDVPLAVSAFDAEFIRDSDIKHLGNLIAYTPGLYGSAEADTQSVFNIRGVGTFAFAASADNSVGVFIDDISIGKPVTSKAAFFDVERVEVLKGPQGTLFGRNTSAGAINVIIRKPDLDKNSLDLTAGFGNEDQQLYEAIGNWAVNDQFGIRLGVRHDERDGTHTTRPLGDEINERDHTVVRLGLRYLWSDAVRTDFSFERFEADTSVGYAPRSMASGGVVPRNFPGTQDVESSRSGLRVEWDLSDSMTLTSLTGFYNVDMVAVPVAFTQTEFLVIDLREPWEIDQWSQEFRLNGTAGRLDWFVGGSFYSEDALVNTEYHYSDFNFTDAFAFGAGDDVDGTVCDNTLNSGGSVTVLPDCVSEAREPGFADSSTTSYAVYGDVAWQASDRVRVTVGARLTFDDKEMAIDNPLADSVWTAITGANIINEETAGSIRADDSWNSFDPRLAIDFHWTDDVMLYGSVSSGYKSGGFNKQPDVAFGAPMQIPLVFNEEQNISYEIGVKSTLWGGRAQLNAAAFFSDYSDLQVENNVGLFIRIDNAADVESKGIELDARVRLTKNFEFMATYAHIDAEFVRAVTSSGDISGNKLTRTPDNSGSAIGVYSIPLGRYGELTLRGEYLYVDQQFWNQGNTDGQDSYNIVNAMVQWTSNDERWGIALMGENVTDETYFIHLSTVLGQNLGIPDIGDLWRLEIRGSF